jgi:pimeloyl-ACP methyl ester carboxylesterase
MKVPDGRKLELRATWLAMRWAGRASTRLAGYLADHLWFTPWRVDLSDSARAKQDAWLQGTTPFETRAGGYKLRGFISDAPRKVLLVHGWGETAASMGAFVPALREAGLGAVAVDLPGHGRSSGHEVDMYKISAALEHVVGTIPGVEAVIAHSMGGHSTLLALSRGLPVDRAVLLAPSTDLTHALDKFEMLFAVPSKAVTGLRGKIERRFGRSVWEDLRAERLVRNVDVPSLIVHDVADSQVDIADVEALDRAWPSARLEKVSGLSHTKIVRDQEVIERAIGFVSARDRSGEKKVSVSA